MIVKAQAMSSMHVDMVLFPVLPWVDLADGDVEACSNVFHCLVTLGDDAHTLSDGLGCDWVVTSHHNYLKHGRRKKIKRLAVRRRAGIGKE